MADNNDRQPDADDREQVSPLGAILDCFAAHPVDLSWAQDFCTKDIDIVEYIAAREALALGLDEELFTAEEDALRYAESIARAASSAFETSRRNPSVDLIVLLIAIARAGYETGVRDCFEGKLTRESSGKIAASLNEANRRWEELRDFREELEGL